MNRSGILCAIGIALVSTFALVGCGPSEEELAAEARVAEWQELQDIETQLAEKRAELRSLNQRLRADLEELEVPEGSSAEEVVAELESDAEALQEEVTTLADEFMPKLVNFINSAAATVGEESDELMQALRMKSDEDIELALEYVERGGDYRRAIEILERAKETDPEYGRLDEVLSEVEDYRYVTQERFDSVEKGMTEAQVRNLLGQVYHRNVREYEDEGAIGWFYPKDPELSGEGAAAAVFFRESDGRLLVDQVQWDAVEARG